MNPEVMQEFLKSVLGDYTLGSWLAYMFFAIIGTVIYSWNEVSQREVPSKKTPRKFSIGFFLRDNIKRFIFTVLLIYIQFRFFEQITGSEMSEYAAFLIGFTSDGLSGMSKKNSKVLQGKRKDIYG